MAARLPQGQANTSKQRARPPQTPVLHTQTLLLPQCHPHSHQPQNRSQRLHFLYFTPPHARPHDHCPPAPNRRYPVI